VPKAFWADLWERARRVAIGDAKTLVERRTVAFKKLAQLNVTAEMILAKLERASVDDVTLDDLEILLGIFQALKEGDSTVEEMFPSPAQESTPTALAGATGDAGGGKVSKGQAKLREALQRAAPKHGTVAPGDGFTFAHVMDQLSNAAKAKDADAFALARDLVKSVADEGQRAELDVEARRLAKTFEADEASARG